MNITKKITSIGVSLTTAIWLSGIIMLSPVAQAVTVAEIQAQINALLAQIQLLQTQLSAAQGTTSVSFTKDLTLGSKGTDVTALQNVLISANKGTAAAALAAVGATGYFGNLTKAALGEYQAAVGISPTAGYFGPKTRAYVASLGGVVPVTPGIPISPIATATKVSLAVDSPTGSVIAGAGNMVVAKFVFSALSAATVTEVKFTKVGVVSDSNINNLYLADETGAVIAQYNSLSSGVATFTSTKLFDVSAGATRTISLRMDLSTSASAGNNIAWQLTSATAAGVTFSGLPISSNTLTVTTVSNPDLAKVTFDHQAVGASTYAGTTGVSVSNATVTVENSAVSLKSIKYTVVGSVSMGDLKNAQLKLNGTQIGSTVASVNSDGTVVFDLSASSVSLPTGNSTLEVTVDVLGSPDRTMTWYILRPYDAYLVDSQYNTGISGTFTDTYSTASTAGPIDIEQGQITVSVSSDTPTGNIPIGASNVTLAKFTVYAAGEAVKVKFLEVKIAQQTGGEWDGTTLAQYTEDIKNIKLIDDVGNQVGNTISTITSNTTNGTCTLSDDYLICHFGTSSSPINYIVPANTTRVISLKTDILSTNDSTSLTGSLTAPGSANLEGQTSFQSATSGTASGSTLTVVTTPLTAALNTAFGIPTYAAGANAKKIASFTITASSAEGAKITTLTFDKDSNVNLDLQSLKIFVGSTQYGITKAIVSDEETSMQFSGNLTVNAGGSQIIDVYADILSSSLHAPTTNTAPIDLTSWTATGLISNSAITFSGAVIGQNVIVSSGPTLTISADSATPPAKQVVMSSTGNELFALRLTNDAVEDVKVTDIRFYDTIGSNTAGLASFENLKLYDGTTVLAGPMGATVVATASSTVLFSLATPLIVPKSDSKTLVLKGDVASYDSGGAAPGSTHTWKINSTSTDITALGKDSNGTVTKAGTATGLTLTVYATKLGLTSSLIGPSSSRSRKAADDLATINWTASAAGAVTVGTVTLNFSGLAISTASTFAVKILKSDGTTFGGSTQTCTPSSNACLVTFAPGITISKGQTMATKVQVVSTNFYQAASITPALSVSFDLVGDIGWSDGVKSNIGLEASLIPYAIMDATYN